MRSFCAGGDGLKLKCAIFLDDTGPISSPPWCQLRYAETGLAMQDFWLIAFAMVSVAYFLYSLIDQPKSHYKSLQIASLIVGVQVPMCPYILLLVSSQP